MDINQYSETKTQQIVEVNGIEFDARKLFKAVSFLRTVDWKGGDKNLMNKMREAGLVNRVAERDPYDMSIKDYTYTQVDRKCSELFDELNEPYSKWRIRGRAKVGVWNELDSEDAKEKAIEKMKELEERNPDVDWELDEESLNALRLE